MRTDRDQFKIITNETIREEILSCMYLEFVDKNTPEVSLFFLSNGGVFQNLADLIVQNSFLLLTKPSNPLLKGSRL
jgi:hypothetical protein